MRQILLDDGILPDFEYVSAQDSTMLDFTHRKTGDTDIYFVVNRLARHGIYDTKYRYLPTLPDRYEVLDCTFRVKNKQPELWDPMSGTIRKLPIYRDKDGRITIPLRLSPEGSAFIIFREKTKRKAIVSFSADSRIFFPVERQKVADWPQAEVTSESGQIVLQAFSNGNFKLQRSDGKTVIINVHNVPQMQKISGSWQILFPQGWGAPQKAVFKRLISWTDSNDNGIKYFSGTATYRKTFTIDVDKLKNTEVYLDLGNVQELSEVFLNDKALGILWMPPFRTNITNALKAGENVLEVRITNLWPNRLIGDQLLPSEKRFTKTNIRKFHKDYPLRISGLLGPVKLVFSKRIAVNF
jgi:hypothetical protein